MFWTADFFSFSSQSFLFSFLFSLFFVFNRFRFHGENHTTVGVHDKVTDR